MSESLIHLAAQLQTLLAHPIIRETIKIQAHFFLSFALFFVLRKFKFSLSLALLCAFSLGFTKEFYDFFRGFHFSWIDIYIHYTGSILAFIISLVSLHQKTFKKLSYSPAYIPTAHQKKSLF